MYLDTSMSLDLNSYFIGREATKGAKDEPPALCKVGSCDHLCDVSFEWMWSACSGRNRTNTYLTPDRTSTSTGSFATGYSQSNHGEHRAIYSRGNRHDGRHSGP
jgi:hypothetical protein